MTSRRRQKCQNPKPRRPDTFATLLCDANVDIFATVNDVKTPSSGVAKASNTQTTTPDAFATVERLRPLKAQKPAARRQFHFTAASKNRSWSMVFHGYSHEKHQKTCSQEPMSSHRRAPTLFRQKKRGSKISKVTRARGLKFFATKKNDTPSRRSTATPGHPNRY